LPVLEIPHNGALFFVEPIAKKESARGKAGVRPLGVLGASGEWVTSHLEIANALKRKAGRYGKVSQPYVIAINCLGPHCDWEEIRDGVYGDEGLWPNVEHPVFTRVSAVVAVHHLLPRSITRAGVVLFHNPNAAYPYSGPLTALPQVSVNSGRPTIVDGTHPREWFGLKEIWPTE
jgi:hypothetical protein